MGKRSRDRTQAETTIGQRIKAARLAKGLSRGELAALVGVDPSTVTGWENGRYRPREGAQRKKLAMALGLDVADLSGAREALVEPDTIELVETLHTFPTLLMQLLDDTKHTVKDVRLAARYTLPPNVQTDFRLAVAARILDGSLEVLRAEIFYSLDRVKEVLSNIFRYHGRKYYVRSYCPGLSEVVPAIGAYAFDDANVLFGGYWLSVPPHDRPGLLLRGPAAAAFFHAYWDEIWQRGTALNLGGADDLSAVRALALQMGLAAKDWPGFVDEARALTYPDGAPPRI